MKKMSKWSFRRFYAIPFLIIYCSSLLSSLINYNHTHTDNHTHNHDEVSHCKANAIITYLDCKNDFDCTHDKHIENKKTDCLFCKYYAVFIDDLFLSNNSDFNKKFQLAKYSDIHLLAKIGLL